MHLSIFFTYCSVLYYLYFCINYVIGQKKVTIDGGKSALCLEPTSCPNVKFRFAGACSCVAPQICCIESGIAQSKCEEYGKFVDQPDYGASLMIKRTMTKVSTCHKTVPLIVGGEKAHPREFPHMVSIGVGPPGNISWVCGGSLISEQHVLTAAHCMASKDLGPAKWAKIGALNISDLTEENSQDFTIVERTSHPEYKPPSRYFDVAIFKLDRQVSITGHVRPACLNTDPEISPSKAVASGWGKLSYASKVGSDHLMKVLLDTIESPKCNETYQVDVGGKVLERGITGTQMCAGVKDDGTPVASFNSQYNDTCQGDSGGPLQVDLDKPYCMYSLLGVTSFGKFCGFKVPGVYTRVSHFVPWIESIVWPS